jgi:hypothetical protein
VASGTWVPSSTAANASRTFHTSNYGGSDLWISNIDGSYITSQGIAVVSDTNYVFSANLVAETNRGARGVDATVDILLGATSLIGGPQTFIAVGDDDVTADSYADQITTIGFSTGTVGVGEELTLVITRVGTSAGLSAAWFGVDNVDVSTIPEPATLGMVAMFGGGILFIRRKLMM